MMHNVPPLELPLLHLAATTGGNDQEQILRVALAGYKARGSDANVRDANGRTAVHYVVAKTQNPMMLAVLLAEEEIDLEARDKNGSTAADNARRSVTVRQLDFRRIRVADMIEEEIGMRKRQVGMEPR